MLDVAMDHWARLDDMGEPRPLPGACPSVLDDMLSVYPDIATLIAKLAVTAESSYVFARTN